jgi:DNA recombination protein RmuC
MNELLVGAAIFAGGLILGWLLGRQREEAPTAPPPPPSEAANLIEALRSPVVGGQWGEIQLRRVVELAGMTAFVDFDSQRTVSTEEGRLRPDLIVRLPNGRTVVVDAKSPSRAFVEGANARDNAERTRKFREHAALVNGHVLRLSEKGYWRQFEHTPEFVVCFLPGESLFSAALSQDPDLLSRSAERNVILATPTTLIALLKAVAAGWRDERAAESAVLIAEAGRQLHERLATMTEHFARTGDSLAAAVKAYNQAIASLEARVLPAARKLEERGARGVKALPEPKPVETQPRDPRQGGLRF